MNCPQCQHDDSKVIDSRTSGDVIRRRRECLRCEERFTTHERIEMRVPWVLKRSGKREPFTREKLLRGVALACRKRPVDSDAMEALAIRVEQALSNLREEEVPSTTVGELVIGELKRVDEVAYVRFASVYRAFESVEQFIDAIRPLREASLETPVGAELAPDGPPSA